MNPVGHDRHASHPESPDHLDDAEGEIQKEREPNIFRGRTVVMMVMMMAVPMTVIVAVMARGPMIMVMTVRALVSFFHLLLNLEGAQSMSKANLETPVRHRACAVCVRGAELLLVKMKDPTSGAEFWTPPGGKIEPDETSESAAIREALEETGYRVQIANLAPVVAQYDFEWDGRLNRCRTVFHLCGLAQEESQPSRVTDADYILSAQWFDLSEAVALLNFHPVIQAAVRDCLGWTDPADFAKAESRKPSGR